MTGPRPLSPCVNICVMHPREGLCVGCFRTLDEIAGWGGLPDATRRTIMAELSRRRDRLKTPRSRPRPDGSGGAP